MHNLFVLVDGVDFAKWRQNIVKVDDENIAEVIAVLGKVAHETILEKKYHVRPIQQLAILSLFKSQNGGLAEIATGEGKSLIIAIFAAIKVLQGHQVDIITSSWVLAARDVAKQKLFYDKIGITVEHNIKHERGVKPLYNSDIVYGDLLHFIGDELYDITENTKAGRGFDVVIADEVDNMFIDQNSRKVQLSNPIPGFDSLKQLMIYMWGTGTSILSMLQEKDGKCYYKKPIVDENDQSDLDNLENFKQKAPEEIKYEFELLKPEMTCYDYSRAIIKNYSTSNLFDWKSNRFERDVIIPSHLEAFVEEHLSVWLDSIFSSYYYEEKLEYTVYDTETYRIIAPIDYKNTGVIQRGLKWHNGLHQFLEIKHGLTLDAESLISIFMSYYGYFGKYKGNIYGVTGTLGVEPHHDFLRKLYGVDLISIPHFTHKDFTEFSPIISSFKDDWLAEIFWAIKSKIGKSRAGLVFVETIADVNSLSTMLRQLEMSAQNDLKNNSQIWTYGTGIKGEEKIVERVLTPGDIIIATNMAGRGTDLQISKEVIKNGGLHVIMTMSPESLRVKDQAYGRAARKGEPGSAQLIIYNPGDNTCGDDISCLYKHRDAIELEKLERDRLCELPGITLRDELFNLYIDLLKEKNSPTGYNIKVGITDKLAPKTLHLYQEKALLALKIISANSESKDIEVSDIIKNLDHKAHKHIANVLSRAPALDLNGQDYELLHFISAKNGFSDYPKIYERVLWAFKEAVRKDVPEAWLEKEFNVVTRYYNRGTEETYLKFLLTSPGFGDLKIENEPIDGKALDDIALKKIFEKVKDRKLYSLWLVDRKLYNNEFEIKQLTEYWAVWLKKREELLNINQEKCDISTEEKIKQTVKKQAEIKEQLEAEFKVFAKEIKALDIASLMKNPGYLVLKALRYWEIHDDQVRLNLKHDNHSAGFGFFAIFSDFIASVKNIFLTSSDLGNYDIPNPLGDAVGFLHRAIELDPVYSWTAHNARSYLSLLKDAGHIVTVEQAQNADLNGILQRYCDDTVETIKKISEYVIPQLEAQISFLSMHKLIDRKDDLFVQLLGTIKIYQKILDVMHKNLDTASRVGGKGMIRLGAGIDLDALTKGIEITVNITESANNTGIKHDQNALRNMTQTLNFTSRGLALSEIVAIGGFLIEVEIYELQEEDEDWFLQY